MLRSNARFISFLQAVADLALVSAAFWGGYVLRVADPLSREAPFGGLYLLLWAAALPAWHLLLRYFGAYQSLRLRSPWGVARPVLLAGASFTLVQLALLYLARLNEISRLVTLVYPALATALLVALRMAAQAVLSNLRRGGYNFRVVLFVGANGATLEYARRVTENLTWGLRVRGVLTPSGAAPAGWPAALPVLGSTETLGELLMREPIDRVVLSYDGDSVHALANQLAVCEELGVEAVVIPPSFQQLQVARIHVEEFYGMPVIHYTTTPAQHVQLAVKRLVDLALSAAVLVFLAPLLAAVAVAVKLDSPGPVFFTQARAGIRGRRFNCYKFRSMQVGAEHRLADLQARNEASGPAFKMRDDPRVTRVGKFIRKYSLDELPQLFNVFRGDMSLVGPRPPLPSEVEKYEPWQRRRLSMKPGITCTWQVSGRNAVDFDTWMRLDLEYIDNWSLRSDFKLLLKTIPAVLKGTGV